VKVTTPLVIFRGKGDILLIKKRGVWGRRKEKVTLGDNKGRKKDTRT